jgi:hypothetical protein
MKPPAYWTAAATRLIALAEPKRVIRYQAAQAPERWRQVIEKDLGLLEEVCSSMKEMIAHQGASFRVGLLSTLLYYSFYSYRGYFIDESDEFARRGGSRTP